MRVFVETFEVKRTEYVVNLLCKQQISMTNFILKNSPKNRVCSVYRIKVSEMCIKL